MTENIEVLYEFSENFHNAYSQCIVLNINSLTSSEKKVLTYAIFLSFLRKDELT